MVAAIPSTTPETTSDPTATPPGATSPGMFQTMAETAKCKAKAAQQQAAEFAQKNPYQALAIACGIGFVAGLILKRR